MSDVQNCLFGPLEELDAFHALCASVARPGAQAVAGVSDSQRLHLLAALAVKTGRPLILVTSSEQAAARAVGDLQQLMPGQVSAFPAREVSFLRTAASSHDLAMRRLHALGSAVTGKLSALVAPADALMHPLMPRALFEAHVIRVKEGQRLDPQELMARLVAAGYERVDVTEARGQCALRGGILDVYPIGQDNALRLEFFDDEVDSLRDFDVMTQRSIARRASAEIFPASEVLLTADMAREAAGRLSDALVAARAGGRASGAPVDRQRALEQEFGLMPYEQFFELMGGDDDGELPSAFDLKPSAKRAAPVHQDKKIDYALRTALGRNFAARLDALKDGRSFAGAESLMPLLYEHTEALEDYFDRPIIALDQPERLRERVDNRLLEFEEHVKTALEREDALPEQGALLKTFAQLLVGFERCALIAMNPFLRTLEGFRFRGIHKFDGIPATGYQGNVHELARDLKRWRDEGWRIALLAGGVARAQRLNRLLFENGCPAPFVDPAPELLTAGGPVILSSALEHGFAYPDIKLSVVTEADIFGASKHKPAAKASSGEKLAAFTDLNVGDYVVHENHGIGRYMGTVRLASEGTFRDFLHIQYVGTDKLYVPTDQLDRVQKYIGSEGEAPKLNRLSGGEWQRQKARVQKAVQDIAGELVKLYARRTSAPGYAFAPDTPWQRQFEDAFEYEETPDQAQAIEEIKRDMEKPRAMDRLLCGDVGYGKTEVALRAIFKCVCDGKQAALLAPTTILVQQHYATMLKRFDGFPVKVDTLSRFKTAAEQKRVIDQLRAGELDVVIGTHRLLGKDLAYKDLGLLVVDEEQRFGVKHKETIKQFKKNIDVLTLSATPIPRTLHMSMVGIRDMSLLRTPPEERYPVQTYVVEYSDGLMRDAILRELSRGGQVYVLHNRVQTIEVMYARLKRLVPEARIAVGHGQMREHALEDVMLDFYEGKYNVLLCTTIIEAGLDVPRANTLIVCDADRFGLAQLYQLRGRVGRSNRLAYAFLTVSPGKVLTETADKRLNAIREFTEFGAGFRVAMRDLEIRGTGNILGAEQSGHMASVGYDLYVKMIEDAVRLLRGDASQGDIETRVELKIDAYLPQAYVPSDMTRVEVYKKIASIRDRDGREDLIEELVDRFGDPGKPVMNLIEIAHLKALCQRLGIESASMLRGELKLRFAKSADPDVARLVAALAKHEKHVRLIAGKEPALHYVDMGKDVEELLRGAVEMLEDVVPKVVEV
ncbi:MAG: transcription-repair coupling factor [Christensenellaceae bacterium]|nr:transcription-repair coupling factor [Christensenellaceae bacterium]